MTNGWLESKFWGQFCDARNFIKSLNNEMARFADPKVTFAQLCSVLNNLNTISRSIDLQISSCTLDTTSTQEAHHLYKIATYLIRLAQTHMQGMELTEDVNILNKFIRFEEFPDHCLDLGARWTLDREQLHKDWREYVHFRNQIVSDYHGIASRLENISDLSELQHTHQFLLRALVYNARLQQPLHSIGVDPDQADTLRELKGELASFAGVIGSMIGRFGNDSDGQPAGFSDMARTIDIEDARAKREEKNREGFWGIPYEIVREGKKYFKSQMCYLFNIGLSADSGMHAAFHVGPLKIDLQSKQGADCVQLVARRHAELMHKQQGASFIASLIADTSTFNYSTT